jgi:hypothetical protein
MKQSLVFLALCLSFLISPAIFAQTASLDTLPNCDFPIIDDNSVMRVGAVLLDFKTGKGCTQSLDDSFQVASVPKIFVAGAYYDWIVQGLVSMNTPITFTDDYYMGGQNDCLRQEDIGSAFMGSELIEAMINCSDNAATWMLMDAVGWLTVNNYIQNTGIAGIGDVVPYSEVDRLKLTMLNPEWQNVPRALASRYFRAGMTVGLEQYLTVVPTQRPSREEEILASSGYFLSYTYNTATPRALAEYFMQLRQALINDPNSQQALVARLLFDAMLYTQRLNSVQAFDGAVLVGGKNGFDRGVVAEVNLLFDDVQTLIPSGLLIVFTQQDNLNNGDTQPPSPIRGILNRYLREQSSAIWEKLYGQTAPSTPQISLKFSSLTLQSQSNIQTCWDSYFVANFDEDKVDSLETCFRSYTSRQTFASGDNVAFGLVLRGLAGADTRLVFVFTAPNGSRASYQTDREYQDKTAIYWYHPVEQVGTWQLDIYLNLTHVYTQTFSVG